MENKSATKSPKTFSPLVFRYFLLLFLVSFLLLGRLLWPFFSILILSFLLSGLFQPVFKLFHSRFKFSQQFSSLVTCFLIVILVFVPLMIFVVALSKEVLGVYPLIKGKNLALMLQQLLEENQTVIWLKEMFAGFGITLHPERITGTLSEFGKVAGFFLYNQASFWAANIMSFVVIVLAATNGQRYVTRHERYEPAPSYALYHQVRTCSTDILAAHFPDL